MKKRAEEIRDQPVSANSEKRDKPLLWVDSKSVGKPKNGQTEVNLTLQKTPTPTRLKSYGHRPSKKIKPT